MSSKYRAVGTKIERKSYATVADFAGPAQACLVGGAQAVATGAEITVTWYPDVYSERRSHKYDWVGLFEKVNAPMRRRPYQIACINAIWHGSTPLQIC